MATVPTITRRSVVEIDQETRDLIIGSMQRWLDGQPLPSCAEIIKLWGDRFTNYRWRWSNNDWSMIDPDFLRGVAYYALRDLWIHEFGFAIPCAEVIEACRKHAPILDVGAGTGYMTKLMRNAGIEAIGTDPFKESGYRFQIGKYDDTQIRITAKNAVRSAWKHAPTVFCSWPTYSHTWFRQMLKAMDVGQRLIVIREDATGDDSAWEYLTACFQEEEVIWIPCWEHLHDRCEVWVKKRNRFDHIALNIRAAAEKRSREEFRETMKKEGAAGIIKRAEKE